MTDSEIRIGIHAPLSGASPLSWGGVSVARNTVYAAAGVAGAPNGMIVAYRPLGVL